MLKRKNIFVLLLLMLFGISFVACSTDTTDEPTMEEIPEIEDVVAQYKVDVHKLNTIYILDGKVYTNGENNNGQLGVGDFLVHEGVQDITDHFALEAGDEIVSVGLGEYHAIALSKNGEIFSWGHNAYGKLALPAGLSQSTPVNITDEFELNDNEMIIYIAVGRDHNAVITSEGRVLTWGVNAYGQLGNGESVNPWEASVYMPQDITEHFELEENDFIVKIDLGNNHSAALSYEGRVFVWGSNEFGQLTLEEDQVLSPTEITDSFTIGDAMIIDISLGYDHTGVLTDDFRVFVFGNNSLNQLGVIDVLYSEEPLEITDQLTDAGNIIRLSFNHDSSAVIGENNIYVFGYNFNYQLGLETNSTVATPTILVNDNFEDKDIMDFIIAKEVYVVVYEDETVMLYGPF